MRTHVAIWVAVLAASLLAAPDFAVACGPHENGGEGHHGRRHHNPGGENDGPGDQQGHRRHGHGRHSGGGEVDVGVGVDVGPGYGPGYGHGRIGPPTAACAELARLRNDLNKLFTIRRQVEAGDVVVFQQPNRHGSGSTTRVMRGVNTYRERNRDQAVAEGLLDQDPTAGLRQNEQ